MALRNPTGTCSEPKHRPANARVSGSTPRTAIILDKPDPSWTVWVRDLFDWTAAGLASPKPRRISVQNADVGRAVCRLLAALGYGFSGAAPARRTAPLAGRLSPPADPRADTPAGDARCFVDLVNDVGATRASGIIFSGAFMLFPASRAASDALLSGGDPTPRSYQQAFAAAKDKAAGLADRFGRLAQRAGPGSLLAGYARLYSCIIRLNWSIGGEAVAEELSGIERDHRRETAVALVAAWYRAIALALRGDDERSLAAFRHVASGFPSCRRWWFVGAAREAIRLGPRHFLAWFY
jgi:hypothetical protein